MKRFPENFYRGISFPCGMMQQSTNTLAVDEKAANF
jgi:hypothetical protein